MKKLIPKWHFTGKPSVTDSVKDRIRAEKTDKVNLTLLQRAEDAWISLSDFRETRLRNFRYVFGDQWGDYVKDGRGHFVTERQRIADRTGGIVLQNNHLVKVVRTMAGLNAKSSTMPVCFAKQKDADMKSRMMTQCLQTNFENNRMDIIFISEMYEVLCGGMAVTTEEWEVHDNQEDVYTYTVDPAKFFFESKTNDPRHWDTSMVGEIRDYTFGELLASLAESEYDAKQLEEIYAPWLTQAPVHSQVTERHGQISFDTPETNNLCRTYHIWTLEYKLRYRCVDIMGTVNKQLTGSGESPIFWIETEDLPAIKQYNSQRLEFCLANGIDEETYHQFYEIQYEKRYHQYWHFQMLAPDGRVLVEYDNPYEHKSHPYNYKIIDFVNGNIVPFIGVVIDQQRYINRLITMHDMMMSAAIKGIKMVPTDCIPSGMSPEEFAEQSVEIGGWLFYKPSKSGNKPEYIVQNTQDANIDKLLQLEVSFINDITSVSEALQGKSPGSSTAASRYAMETENSTTAIAAFLKQFNHYMTEVANKKMKMIQQFYTEPRNISSERSNGYADYAVYDPKEVGDIPFYVTIKEAPNSPIFRMMKNELLERLWAAGQIDAEQLVSLGYYPDTEELKQVLSSQKEAGLQAQPATQPTAINQQQ